MISFPPNFASRTYRRTARAFLLCCALQAARSAPSNDDPRESAFEKALKPMIRATCISCHNATDLEGDLDLEKFLTVTPAEALKQRKLLELVVERVRAKEMPPEDEPQPSPAQVAEVIEWIERHYAAVDLAAPANPGRVTMRRLNRSEYNNTIRDLLGVNLRISEDFPPDPFGYGFDNIGDVLSLSPVLTEKYLKSAEDVAQLAIPLEKIGIRTERYKSETMGQESRLHIQTKHDIPADGVYTIRMGWEQGNPTGTKHLGALFMDGKPIAEQTVVFQSYQNQDRAIYARDVWVTRGTHLFEARMAVEARLQSPNDPSDGFARVSPAYPTVLEIVGPTEVVPMEETDSYRRIFFKGPPKPGDGREYSREIFAKLLPRAYRRPATPGEVDQITRLSDLVRERGGSFEEGIQIGLTAILVSPNFLFRVERDPKFPGDDSYRITDMELASRLSYFLWGSMPDDALFSLAESGRLAEPAVLLGQVRRMLKDPKARALSRNFASQWLQTRNLEVNSPDRQTFPDFDHELRDAMLTETELFFRAVVEEDRDVLDFIDGRFTFLNERLAKHYGIPDVKGREFRRVELDGNERSGILTHASVLTVSSYPTRTSPVIRGKWILENLLHSPPPPPPPNVPNLDETVVGKTASLREQLELHRSNMECASCHSRMDPLGFGLENYDAVGRWRTRDGDFAVDASGKLPNGRTFKGSKELKAMLRSDSPRFIRALTEKMMIFALGRGLETYDRPTVEQVAARVESNGGRISEMISAIVQSSPFLMRTRASVPDRTAATNSLSANNPTHR